MFFSYREVPETSSGDFNVRLMTLRGFVGQSLSFYSPCRLSSATILTHQLKRQNNEKQKGKILSGFEIGTDKDGSSDSKFIFKLLM